MNGKRACSLICNFDCRNLFATALDFLVSILWRLFRLVGNSYRVHKIVVWFRMVMGALFIDEAHIL